MSTSLRTFIYCAFVARDGQSCRRRSSHVLIEVHKQNAVKTIECADILTNTPTAAVHPISIVVAYAPNTSRSDVRSIHKLQTNTTIIVIMGIFRVDDYQQ